MLGEKIYNLRKNRKISQEEFADALNTTRQAVSKWERNEAKPDIDKLIMIAKLFNVSIDYLLCHEIRYSDVDIFMDKLKNCYSNNNFIININDIKMWCSKYVNNFKLHLYSAEYLYLASLDNYNEEYLELALSYINKTIVLFTPDYNEIISLNELHMCVAEIYVTQQKYDLAKEYIIKNKIYRCEILLAKCELELNNYEKALESASEIYLNSTSNIINAAYIQVVALLKNNKVQDAFDYINWTISFIDSTKNNDDLFDSILAPFFYIKAACEQLLSINNEETIEVLKRIIDKSMNRHIIYQSKSLKYYYGKSTTLLTDGSNIENILKKVINQANKKDVYYQSLIDIYNQVLGG